MDFLNKTVLITGAGSGMGALSASEFARGGANVMLVDVNPESIGAVAKEINDGGVGKAETVVCDVRNYEEVAAACESAVKIFGSIDIVVNLAGGAETRIFNVKTEFPDTPIEVYDWSIDVNLKGQMYFCHAALKYMREQKSGVIINIGSITGEEGGSPIAYSASKSGAMGGLTKSIAAYGSKYGIRCVCVSPGPVLTRPGMASMRTAMGRAAEPQEIVDVILFVASDKASFITGTNILADGGRNVLYR